MQLKDSCSLGENCDKPRQHTKKQRHHLNDRGAYSHSFGLSSSHVQMWELDHNEGWVQKYGCFQTVLLKNTLECPLDCELIKPVSPKGNQTWILIGNTDAKTEALTLWPPVVESQLTGKDCLEGWRQIKKGAAVDEMLDNVITNSVDMYLGKLRETVGFPAGSDSKESACNAGDLGSIPGLGRFPGEGNGYPFQYSC